MKSWTQDVKAEIRRQLMKSSKNGGFVAKVALMMPAQTCLCVKEALKFGIFDKSTFIIAIEKEKEAVPLIEKELKRLGFLNFVVIRKEMVNINEKYLLNFINFEELDYVYLDLMGTPSNSNEKWFENVLSRFINFKTQVAVTFMNADRTNNCDWTPDIPYKFSEKEKTNTNAKKAAELVLYSLAHKGKRVIRYGRCYHNEANKAKNEDSGCPMVTFLSGFGWSQKQETHKRFAYDLGYA
jgi:hypothetical protein